MSGLRRQWHKMKNQASIIYSIIDFMDVFRLEFDKPVIQFN